MTMGSSLFSGLLRPEVHLLWVAFAALVSQGCGSLTLKEDLYACTPGDEGTCPQGWVCRESSTSGTYRCFRSGAQGDAGVDASVDARAPDAGSDSGVDATSDAAASDAKVDASSDGALPCTDNDGDGYGDGCALGDDCDDNAPGITGPCQPNGCPQGWVLIPEGEFQMGCSETDACWAAMSEESPRHPVTLSAYCIQETEVSVGQFRACVDAALCTGAPCETSQDSFSNWSTAQSDREDHPLNSINWQESRQHCALWLGGDLPSEAQWEKAARGTGGIVYPWGDSPPPDCDHCNYDANGVTVGYGCGFTVTGPGTWEVSALTSPDGDSPYGLKDMAGNVWEWVLDCFDPSFYDTCAQGCEDPVNDVDGCAGLSRVARGGSFDFGEVFVRAVHRFAANPSEGTNNIGFRCARAPRQDQGLYGRGMLSTTPTDR